MSSDSENRWKRFLSKDKQILNCTTFFGLPIAELWMYSKNRVKITPTHKRGSMKIQTQLFTGLLASLSLVGALSTAQAQEDVQLLSASEIAQQMTSDELQSLQVEDMHYVTPGYRRGPIIRHPIRPGPRPVPPPYRESRRCIAQNRRGMWFEGWGETWRLAEYRALRNCEAYSAQCWIVRCD